MTVLDAVKQSGFPIVFAKKSIQHAETLLLPGETLISAAPLNYALGKEHMNAALLMTSHRLLTCSVALSTATVHTWAIADCACGEISGKFSAKLSIQTPDGALIIEGSNQNLPGLQTALTSAIANADQYPPLDIPEPEPTTEPVASPQPQVPYKSDTIKICADCGDRLLSTARQCPTCGSKRLTSVDRDDTQAIANLRQAGQAVGRKPKAPQPAYVSKKEVIKQRIADNKAAGIACCPKCGSASLTANKKGFGVGKAVAGGLTIGAAGLLAGGIGANKVVVTCLNCGHQYKP